jgi:hypothetical protein
MSFTLPSRHSEARHRDRRAFAAAPRGNLSTFRVSLSPEELPDWSVPVVARLGQLLRLRDGWTGGGSRRIERRLAEEVLNDVLPRVMPSQGGKIPQLVPCVDGGLQIEWHSGGWDIEISLAPTGEAWVEGTRIDGSESWDGSLDERHEDLSLALKSMY